MSTADIVLASLAFGPGTLASTAIGISALAGRSRTRYMRGLLNECRAMNTAIDHPTNNPPPDDGGEPHPAPVIPARPEPLADVIPLHRRRAA